MSISAKMTCTGQVGMRDINRVFVGKPEEKTIWKRQERGVI
jgi:hypothetical protein